MMQFHQCRKQEMKSSTRLQHNDVTSCKQRHLIEKTYRCKEVSTCYNHRKFGKVSFINEGVIAFSKKVHVFLRHPVHDIYFSKIHWVVHEILSFIFSLFLIMTEAAILDDQFVSKRGIKIKKKLHLQIILIERD